jgi:hypothetical protein
VYVTGSHSVQLFTPSGQVVNASAFLASAEGVWEQDISTIPVSQVNRPKSSQCYFLAAPSSGLLERNCGVRTDSAGIGDGRPSLGPVSVRRRQRITWG